MWKVVTLVRCVRMNETNRSTAKRKYDLPFVKCLFMKGKELAFTGFCPLLCK